MCPMPPIRSGVIHYQHFKTQRTQTVAAYTLYKNVVLVYYYYRGTRLKYIVEN